MSEVLQKSVDSSLALPIELILKEAAHNRAVAIARMAHQQSALHLRQLQLQQQLIELEDSQNRLEDRIKAGEEDRDIRIALEAVRGATDAIRKRGIPKAKVCIKQAHERMARML